MSSSAIVDEGSVRIEAGGGLECEVESCCGVDGGNWRRVLSDMLDVRGFFGRPCSDSASSLRFVLVDGELWREAGGEGS